MKIKTLIAAICCLLLASSCVSTRYDTETDTATGATVTTARTHVGPTGPDSLGSAYIAANGIKPYHGSLFKLELIDWESEPGELISVELWPIFEVAVGLVGARVHVLPFEVGAGVLLYTPEPKDYWGLYDDDVDVDVDRVRVKREGVIRDRDTDVDVRVRTDQ